MGIRDAPAHTSKGIGTALWNFDAANFRKWTKALVDVQLGTSDARSV
jgi:hypothetical protein